MTTSGLVLVAALLAGGVVPFARADGGQILLHRSSGALDITVFASPEPLSTGDEDLSVLVQDGSSQQPLPDADLSLTLNPPHGLPVTLRLNPENAGIGLMRSTTYRFDQPGRWTLSVSAKHDTARSFATAAFEVGKSHSRRTIVWTFALLPLLLIGLFALHRRLKTPAGSHTERPAQIMNRS